MEDQQPAADDLTDADPDASAADSDSHEKLDEQATRPAEEVDTDAESDDVAAVPEDDEAETAGADTAGADTAATADTADASEDDSGRKIPFVKRLTGKFRRPTGKQVAAVVAGLVVSMFVGSAAFAGTALQPYLADRAVVAVKLKVARTAANAITTLWTYTPENMDSLADRAAIYLSGDFGAQYRKFVDSIVAPNKQAKVTNNTEVTGVAVESLDGPNAVAIVYTNTTTVSPLTKNIPAMKYLSYRLVMKRDHARWFVTRMTTITSLDLTPRL